MLPSVSVRAEGLPGVGVVGAYPHLGDLGEGHLLGGVVEEDEVQAVAGVLGAQEVGEGQGHLLGRGEAVLSVKDHGVGNVDHKHCRSLGFELIFYNFQVIFI